LRTIQWSHNCDARPILPR